MTGFLLAEDGGHFLAEDGGHFLAEALPVAFPDSPLDVRGEILLSTGWTDVTPWMDHGPVAAGRGHPDESATVAPSTLTLTLTNSAAEFSPDNVMSPFWPDLIQNTPVRVSIPAQRNYLRLEENNADRAYVNDNAAIDITGSIEIRITLRLTDRQGCVLACKWDGGGCWEWLLGGDGTMLFAWYDSGAAYHQVISSAPLPFTSGDLALRVTMDVTTGTVAFYTATGVSVDPASWTQLGTAASGTGGTATSVGVSHVSALAVGYSFNISPAQLFGRVYEFRLYNGIGGTVVADGVFTAQAAGAASWTDTQGNLWQLAGGAEVSDRDYRGHAEGSEWPQDEPAYNPGDAVPADALVQVVGGGLLRRYSQRSNPARSAMYRAVTRQAGTLAPVAYWPGEESAGATQFGSAAGGPPMMINGTPSLAADSSFLASAPLPVLNGAVLTGQVPAYVSNGSVIVRFLCKLGTLPATSYATLLRLSMTGTVRALYVVGYSGGALGLIGYDSGGNTVVDTGPVAFGAAGENAWYSVEVQPATDGAVQVSLITIVPGADSGPDETLTLAGATVGNCTEITVNPNGFFTDTVAGHVSVQSDWVSMFTLGQPLNGWQTEPAGKRFARLCAEEGIPCRTRGNLADTTLMGPQQPQTLVQLLQQCADADQGVWYETRQVLGWGYVTRKALYNQPAGPQLSYNSDHLSPWMSPPTRDDQFVVNDVTMQSATGGSARVFAAPGQPIDGGRMSVLDPRTNPGKGAGTYDQQYQVMIQNDGDLRNLAGWRLHRGTVDEARLPGIMIDLTGRDLAAQFWAILDMDLGDRLTLSDPPARLGPDTVSQLAQQMTETLWHRTLEVAVTGVPESPYQVAQAGAAHAQTDGSALAAAATATATTLSVAATGPSGIPWTTSAADFPFDVKIAGERMTVTGIGATGALSLGTADGTFESGVADWTPGGGTVAQTNFTPHSGTFCAQVFTSGTPAQVTLRPAGAYEVAVIPGVSYTAAMWIRDVFSQTFHAAIDWFDAAGVRLSTSSGPSASPAGGAWTQFSVSGTAPAGAAKAVYGPTSSAPAAGGYFYCDDILFTVLTQVFTVTRSVNGVAKVQTAGAQVKVYPPPVAAL